MWALGISHSCAVHHLIDHRSWGDRATVRQVNAVNAPRRAAAALGPASSCVVGMQLSPVVGRRCDSRDPPLRRNDPKLRHNKNFTLI